MSMPINQAVCVIVGVGPGNGTAFARRFALEGYRVALLARHTEFTLKLATEIDGAKAAQKSLAESMARQLGPEGIHVALLIVDGVVDTPATRAMMPDKPDDYFLKAADIADAVFHLSQQKPSAWSSEMEVRPFGEHW